MDLYVCAWHNTIKIIQYLSFNKIYEYTYIHIYVYFVCHSGGQSHKYIRVNIINYRNKYILLITNMYVYQNY